MVTLEDMRKKYPTCNYAPKADCKRCKGNGEYMSKAVNRMTCCICIFVMHEHCEEIGKSIAKVARKLKEEMNL